MTRIYKNPNASSPIEAIIIPKKKIGYPTIYSSPRIVIRPDIDRASFYNDNLIELLTPKEVTGDDAFITEERSYLPKKEGDFLCHITHVIEALKESNLIGKDFYAQIHAQESKRYYEKMEVTVNRRTYPIPENETSVIQAFIVQRHGGNECPFIRFDEKNREKVNALLNQASLKLDDRMPSQYENYWIVSSIKGTKADPLITLDRLMEIGLISSRFGQHIHTQEKSYLNKQLNEAQKTKMLNDLQEKFPIELRSLEKIILDYSLASKKVKHGSFQGALGRHLREIVHLHREMSRGNLSQNEALKGIVKAAKNLGDKHPIMEAGQKCYAKKTFIDSLLAEKNASLPKPMASSRNS